MTTLTLTPLTADHALIAHRTRGPIGTADRDARGWVATIRGWRQYCRVCSTGDDLGRLEVALAIAMGDLEP